MMLSTPILVGGGLAAGGAALYFLGDSPAVKKVSGGAQRETLRAFGRLAQATCNWPGLADFLDVVAAQESAWHVLAVNDEGGPNAARGAYQIRPRSGFPDRGQFAGVAKRCPDLLLSAQWSTFCATWYAARLQSFGNSRSTFADLRCGWAWPSIVNPWSANSIARFSRRRSIVSKFAARSTALGYPGLGSRPAWPDGMRLPALGALAMALGIPWSGVGSPCDVPIPRSTGEADPLQQQLRLGWSKVSTPESIVA